MLVVTRKNDESIIIGDNIEITILETSKDKVKIGISAPRDITVIRNELLHTQETNKDSSAAIPKEALNAFLKLNNKEE